MASTNKTGNLGLNQWVMTDPVLMEDFNKDNEKIDGAIDRLRYEKLREFATNSSYDDQITQIDVDVKDIDFRQYSKLCLNTSFQTHNSSVYLRINNAVTGYAGIENTLPSNVNFNNNRNYFLALSGGVNNSSYCSLSVSSIELTICCSPFFDSVGLMGQSFSVSGYFITSSPQFNGSNILSFGVTGVKTFADIQSLNFVVSGSYYSGGSQILLYGLKR